MSDFYRANRPDPPWPFGGGDFAAANRETTKGNRMKHNYKWARVHEITLYQFFFMCQTHAERFIGGDRACYVLDDSGGELTATRKGDTIVMVVGRYDVGGEWSEWCDVSTIDYDDDRKVLGARLAATYSGLVYDYSPYFRNVCLPVTCEKSSDRDDAGATSKKGARRES